MSTENAPEDPPKEETIQPPDMPQTDLPVGEILRRARAQAGLSLHDVEAALRIRASQLQAIEEMNLEALPGWVYTVGFVRTYAEYLRLDGDKVVQLMKTQTGRGKRARPQLSFPSAASDTQMPDLYVLGGAGAGILLLIILIVLWATPDREIAEEIPPPPTEETITEISLPEAIEDPALTAPEEEGEISMDEMVAEVMEDEPLHRIIINVTEKSWVEIRDSEGTRIVSRVLNPGDAYFVPKEAEGLIMTTGNAAGIQVEVDGEILPALGRPGDIRRNIPLDPDSLKEMFE